MVEHISSFPVDPLLQELYSGLQNIETERVRAHEHIDQAAEIEAQHFADTLTVQLPQEAAFLPGTVSSLREHLREVENIRGILRDPQGRVDNFRDVITVAARSQEDPQSFLHAMHIAAHVIGHLLIARCDERQIAVVPGSDFGDIMERWKESSST